MKILIMGGSGLIGYHAVKLLYQQQYQLTAMVRSMDQARQLLPAGVNLVSGDLDCINQSELEELLDGMDGLLFAAGVDERCKPSGNEFDFYYRKNVSSAQKVFRAAANAGVQQTVLISSIFSYFDQLDPQLKLSASHPYIRSRIFQEHHCIGASNGRNRIKILQLPFVFGTVAGREPLLKSLIDYLRSPIPPFVTNGGASMIAVQHVAQAIAGAFQDNSSTIFYQIGDENLSWQQLMQMICEIDGQPKRPIKLISNSQFTLMTKTGGLFKNLLNIRSGLDTMDISPLVTAEMYFDPQPARDKLQFGQGGLYRALQETVAAC